MRKLVERQLGIEGGLMLSYLRTALPRVGNASPFTLREGARLGF